MLKIVPYEFSREIPNKIEEILKAEDKTYTIAVTTKDELYQVRNNFPDRNCYEINVKDIDESFYTDKATFVRKDEKVIILRIRDVENISMMLLEIWASEHRVYILSNVKIEESRYLIRNFESLNDLQNEVINNYENSDFELVLDYFHMFDYGKGFKDMNFYIGFMNTMDKSNVLLITSVITPSIEKILSDLYWNQHNVHILKLH